MKTTPERLDELERLYLEQADCLDASSYDIEDLIHDAREAHRLARLDDLLLPPLPASPHDGDHDDD